MGRPTSRLPEQVCLCSGFPIAPPITSNQNHRRRHTNTSRKDVRAMTTSTPSLPKPLPKPRCRRPPLVGIDAATRLKKPFLKRQWMLEATKGSQKADQCGTESQERTREARHWLPSEVTPSAPPTPQKTSARKRITPQRAGLRRGGARRERLPSSIGKDTPELKSKAELLKEGSNSLSCYRFWQKTDPKWILLLAMLCYTKPREWSPLDNVTIRYLVLPM